MWAELLSKIHYFILYILSQYSMHLSNLLLPCFVSFNCQSHFIQVYLIHYHLSKVIFRILSHMCFLLFCSHVALYCIWQLYCCSHAYIFLFCIFIISTKHNNCIYTQLNTLPIFCFNHFHNKFIWMFVQYLLPSIFSPNVSIILL